MGQQHSKEHKRLDELGVLIGQTHKLLDSLSEPAAADFVRASIAGIPIAPDGANAQYDAAFVYLKRLNAEQAAILKCMSEWRRVQPSGGRSTADAAVSMASLPRAATHPWACFLTSANLSCPLFAAWAGLRALLQLPASACLPHRSCCRCPGQGLPCADAQTHPSLPPATCARRQAVPAGNPLDCWVQLAAVHWSRVALALASARAGRPTCPRPTHPFLPCSGSSHPGAGFCLHSRARHTNGRCQVGPGPARRQQQQRGGWSCSGFRAQQRSRSAAWGGD